MYRYPMSLPLLQLPEDLQLRVAELAPDDDADRAALCLAAPRLGLAAIRALPAYQGLLLSVGLRLFGAGAADLIDERLLRRYAARGDATAAGCAWLERCAQQVGSPWRLRLEQRVVEGSCP